MSTVHGIGSTAPLTGCTCVDDPDLDRLRDLIAAGIPQAEASRLLWGQPTPTTVRAWVRHQYRRALPWLRLPDDERTPA